ncbi:ROK family protein [Histidinibacterium aquaticum]|uniref:N-acetylglucosamine kinase n=1 Tax=Histidinibacterium aquaticum TaxID=2613962 RepID=A0A5J5GIJ5_9RHOB|nr:ROK family protein [Histidinibacterium aquaticum]KAA9008051.1 ROK family protein [Histidinibacterium aquaticum]
MIAAGIDLGGSKIETRLFDEEWQLAHSRRRATPGDYGALLTALLEELRWIFETGGKVPVGLGTAGLLDPVSGHMIAANLPISGRNLLSDLDESWGPVSLVNDAQAFALSEAAFGAARGAKSAAGVILGTGVSAGFIGGDRLAGGYSAASGEVGHLAAPAHLVGQFDLPVHACGCGRTGCVETYISGPGLAGLARHMTGTELSSETIGKRRAEPALAPIWSLWCALTAEMLMGLVCTVDPEVIVLGGGLSRIVDVERDLGAALSRAQIAGLRTPEIRIAEGGDASGARGAALAAWQAAHG